MEGLPTVITVVCTGNICRSPMAAALLRHALDAEPEPLSGIEVRSAGIAAYAGDPASRNAVKAMQAVHLDLEDHRSRPLSNQMVDTSDLILVMTSSHLEAIRRQHPQAEARLFRFREWMDAGSREVPDPFGGPLDLYIETRDSLAEAIPSILNYLRSQLDT